jgi:arylsulfatase A-like enzyme
MARPKHIVLISTDHMRYDCVGAYGNDAIHTPNLDRLAGSGVNFHSCFTQGHCCMPSRASFFTSLYPQQTGVTENGFCLPDEFEPVAPRCFRSAGYHTGHIGKLHLQPTVGMEYAQRPRNTYGFDTFHCAASPTKPHDAWTRYLDMHYPEHKADFLPTDAARAKLETPGRRVIDAPWLAGHSGFCAAATREYFAMRGFNHQFVHVGLFAPHPPLTPSAEAFAPYDGVPIPRPRFGCEEWADKPEGKLTQLLKSRQDWSEEDFIEYRRYFYALTTELDLAVGHILETLEQRGELDDTLLVFTSDHGDMCGDHSLTVKGPHFYDEIMHVPLILHWPAGLGRDRRDIHEMIEMVDLLPTMLGLAGARPHERMMGRNYAADLLAGRQIPGREDVYATAEPERTMLRTAKWKYLRYGPGQEVLYDLSDTDRYEVVNRAGDPACGQVLQEMRDRMLTRSIHAGRSPRRRLSCW